MTTNETIELAKTYLNQLHDNPAQAVTATRKAVNLLDNKAMEKGLNPEEIDKLAEFAESSGILPLCKAAWPIGMKKIMEVVTDTWKLHIRHITP